MNMQRPTNKQGTTELATSELDVSSTEMCYFDLSDTNPNYKINITNCTFNPNNPVYTPVRYGYAWCTDEPFASPVTQEGIYYIKNKATEEYLKYDNTNNGQMSLDSMSVPDSSYQWIVKKGLVTNNGTYYNIFPNYASAQGKLDYGPVINGEYNHARISSEGVDLFIGRVQEITSEYDMNDNDGAYYINNTVDLAYMSAYNGETVAWHLVFTNNAQPDELVDEERWYLEKVNYRRGDANADGQLNMNDVSFLQQKLASSSGLGSMTNAQRFLADANYDTQILITDVTKVQRILSHLDIY
jgi:hypothetical protein